MGRARNSGVRSFKINQLLLEDIRGNRLSSRPSTLDGVEPAGPADRGKPDQREPARPESGILTPAMEIWCHHQIWLLRGSSTSGGSTIIHNGLAQQTSARTTPLAPVDIGTTVPKERGTVDVQRSDRGHGTQHRSQPLFV